MSARAATGYWTGFVIILALLPRRPSCSPSSGGAS